MKTDSLDLEPRAHEDFGVVVLDHEMRVYGVDRRAKALLGDDCRLGAPLAWCPEPEADQQVWSRAMTLGQPARVTGVQLHRVTVAVEAVPLDGDAGGAVVHLWSEGAGRASPDVEWLRSAFEASLDALYVLEAVRDGDGTIVDFRIVDCNAAALRQMSLEREAFVGQLICEAYPVNRTNGYFDRYVRVATTGEPLSQRLDIPMGLPGAGCYLQQTVALPGGRGVVTSTRDISMVRDAEEARAELAVRLVKAQKMESVGRITGGVAHDFNNLLTAMLGLVDLAGDFDDVASVRELLDEVAGLLNRAAVLTRRLTRLGSRSETVRETVDLRARLTGFVDLLERVMPASLRVATDLGPDDAIFELVADSAQLEQVLLNLCLNAHDAIARGSVDGEAGCISIRLTEVSEVPDACQIPGRRRGRFAAITVEDDGVGFDGHEDQALEPFFTTRADDGGTGLGLASVATIVDDHEGAVHIERGREVGASVTIYLPLGAPTRAGAVPATAEGVPSAAAPSAPIASAHVLVVEDDPAVRDLVVRILESVGHEVAAADNGADAVEHFQRTRPDLVVMDGVMPTMSGFEAWRRIVDIDPAARVLFMSGYSSDVFPDGFFEHDGHRLLRKPFTRERVVRMVSEALCD